ncbi:MAG: N-acetyl-alpha-D-glucosaminyl L-malate synthase [Glaciecola sp. HTCC2999]|nr:MAG: N-acetyl-alpha-D-glucosaminyl L-malate synthase [Glaciecola sp. HTCC2999]
MSKPTPILFVHYGHTEWIRGSERCLIDLIHHLDLTQYTPILWCDTQIMAQQFADLDMPVYVEPFSLLLGWHQPRFDVKATQALITSGQTIIEKHAIKILHANSAAPNQWLTSLANSQNIPLVTHLHARYVFSERLTLRVHQADHVIGVSAPIIAQLREDGIKARRTHVIANGIDTTRLLQQTSHSIRNKQHLAEDTLVLVSVGSLIERKGMDIIIQAVAIMQTHDIDVHLCIIGAGEALEQLIALVVKLNLEPYVTFLGEQNEAFGWLSEADIFVSGAREEVFGLVLAEAGLAKLPCVAPDVGGIASVIEDGITGLLTPSESPQAIADACLRLAHDPELRQSMGQAGYERILANFTIARNVEQCQQIYQMALAQGRCYSGRLWQQTTATLNVIKHYGTALLRKLRGAPLKQKAFVCIDTIPFAGGSKIATSRMLATLHHDPKHIHVLSTNPSCWQDTPYTQQALHEFGPLTQAQSGWRFVLRHVWLALQILWHIIRIRRVVLVAGCSLPSNDFALAMIKKVTGIEWLQCIHGPVYPSRLNARLLNYVDYLFYLPSTVASLDETLALTNGSIKALSTTTYSRSFINGVSLSEYQLNQVSSNTGIQILWAASALRWKGLDLFVEALQHFDDTTRPNTHICYIRPTQIDMPVSDVDTPLANLQWHESPKDLAIIREACQIFVSTSTGEPFGLSILEALASGLCVVIPADNAFWDLELVDQENCVKYQPNDPQSLFLALSYCLSQPEMTRTIGVNGRHVAQRFDAKTAYGQMHNIIEGCLI